MISRGTILIEEGTPLPQSFRLETEEYPSAWMSLGSHPNARQFETELASTGWFFLYVAGEVRVTAFGFDKSKSIHTALKRLIEGATKHNCNCLEIDTVENHSFFGVPWVSVSAHSRRIQHGQTFSNPAGSTTK